MSEGANTDTTSLESVVARPDLWFYPGEELDPNEMRVTLMGTGWGNIIRPNQKGASIFVELGNGDSFVFDTGPGSGINYNVMQVPASRMTKIFFTHLHLDHTSDLAWMYAFGPASDRYTPLQLWGPSGTEPELGARANLGAIRDLTAWHRPSFEACLDVGDGYDLEITELDYRQNPGVAYEQNGVVIKHFPVLHIMDGAIGYRLEWNGLSMVWTGDTQPTHFVAENAKNVDLLIHETAPTPERYSQATGLPMAAAKIVVANSHTPAKALGKILQLAVPVSLDPVVDGLPLLRVDRAVAGDTESRFGELEYLAQSLGRRMRICHHDLGGRHRQTRRLAVTLWGGCGLVDQDSLGRRVPTRGGPHGLQRLQGSDHRPQRRRS